MDVTAIMPNMESRTPRGLATFRSTSFLNAQVSDFHVLSDDCFTCHVSFDFVLTSRRENDYTYPTAYTLCIVKRKGTGALYNIVFH